MSFTPKVYTPEQSIWDDIPAEDLTMVEISTDSDTPYGVARNAIMDRFEWLQADAELLCLHADKKDVEHYLDTLGIEYKVKK